jgi:hypothetical protein
MPLDSYRHSEASPVEGRIEDDQKAEKLGNNPFQRTCRSEDLASEPSFVASDQEGDMPASFEPNQEDKSVSKLPVEESAEARLARLGRQRPEAFDSIWSEIGFVFAISMSQVLSVRTSIFLSFGYEF